MRCEFPMLTRCCFCFPLRLGLLVWAYIKTISSAVLLLFSLIVEIEDCKRRSRSRNNSFLAFYIPIWSMLAMDIIFHIIFIISAHKKEHRKMRLFYRYSIFSLLMYTSGFIFSISIFFIDGFMLYAFFFGLFQMAIFMWIMIIEMYVLILVRSEIVKLKRNSNFEFVNNAAEGELRVESAVTKVDLGTLEELQY